MQHSHTQHFHLHTAQTLALHLVAGSVVQVSNGRIWLTLEGHSRDVWLVAPAQWTVPLAATAWVSADAAAAFTVSQPAPQRACARPKRPQGQADLAPAAT